MLNILRTHDKYIYLLDCRIRIPILPVSFCRFSILDGEFRASMKTAQAHDTLILNPYWMAIFHLNRMRWTSLLAEPASDTLSLIHTEMRCFRCNRIHTMEKFCKRLRNFALCKISMFSLIDTLRNIF